MLLQLYFKQTNTLTLSSHNAPETSPMQCEIINILKLESIFQWSFKQISTFLVIYITQYIFEGIHQTQVSSSKVVYDRNIPCSPATHQHHSNQVTSSLLLIMKCFHTAERSNSSECWNPDFQKYITNHQLLVSKFVRFIVENNHNVTQWKFFNLYKINWAEAIRDRE